MNSKSIITSFGNHSITVNGEKLSYMYVNWLGNPVGKTLEEFLINYKPKSCGRHGFIKTDNKLLLVEDIVFPDHIKVVQEGKGYRGGHTSCAHLHTWCPEPLSEIYFDQSYCGSTAGYYPKMVSLVSKPKFEKMPIPRWHEVLGL